MKQFSVQFILLEGEAVEKMEMFPFCSVYFADGGGGRVQKMFSPVHRLYSSFEYLLTLHLTMLKFQDV